MPFGEWWRRLVFLIRRDERIDEMDEELRLHADLRAEKLRGNNALAQEAEIAAKRQLGNRTLLKEQAWDVWTFTPIENLWRDFKSGGRVLRSSPGFAITAILTLALGVGATTAMFSVIDNVLLEPFPYAHQQRLVSIVIHDLASGEAGGRTTFPAVEFLDYQKQNRVFDDVMGVAINRALWTTGGTPESVNAPIITANAFQFLGVPPVLGRSAVSSDVDAGAPPVCVMSYGFWQSRFAGDRHVIGKSLVLDGTSRTVIGVMPPRFVFWSGDVWIPARLQVDRGSLVSPPWFYMLGRLKTGLTVKTADPQVQLLAEQLANVYRPNLYPYKFTATLQTWSNASVGKFRQTLLTLLAAVGLLLAIACANVANLLLARASHREREFAIRVGLGAGWWRLFRQLFAESLLLALLGATAGCGFAWVLLKALVAVLPGETFPDEAVIGLNLRVLVATMAVSVCTALFFGLFPALSGLRRDTNEALKSGGRAHSGVREGRLQKGLIVFETAIALVLLAGAGVMMRSFLLERAVSLGLNSQHVLTAQIYLTKGQSTLAQKARFNGELLTALRRLPGVVSVATTTDFLPFGGAPTEFVVPGKATFNQWQGQFALIDPNLFYTLEVPLLQGRNLDETDVAGKHRVAVVNQAFVAKFFPGKDAIGQPVHVTTLAYLPEPLKDPSFQIVGVVGDFRNRGLRQPVMPEAYIPYTISGLGGFSVYLRAAGDAGTLAKVLEGTVLTLDANAVVRHMRTMQQGVEAEEFAKPRFGLEIFAVFALIGLALASAGLYSVTAYAVSRREREIGIRLALGATAGEVQSMVVRSGMWSVAFGIISGVVAALALLRFLQSEVWGIATYDPMTLGCVAVILALAGLAGCYLPSLMARRVDPALTLRAE